MLAFVIGAAAGAALALVLAPDSGEKTREKIRKGVSDLTGKVKGEILDGLDIVEAVLEEE